MEYTKVKVVVLGKYDDMAWPLLFFESVKMKGNSIAKRMGQSRAKNCGYGDIYFLDRIWEGNRSK